jgi:hypothetical protein
MSIDDELRRAARAHRERFDQAPVPDLPVRAGRRMRAVIVVAVACIVVAVVSVVVVTRRSPNRVRVVTSPSSTAAQHSEPALRDAAIAAAPLLAPTWTPNGEELWSVTSTSGSNGPGFPTQLFGTATPNGTLSPGLLLEYQPNPPGGAVAGTTTTRVRGVVAAVDPPKDAAGADVEIRWVEANTEIAAIFRGVSTSRAVAVLDALRARGSDLMTGFDPASAPPDFALLGERTTADAAEKSIDAAFEYVRSGPAADSSADIEVRTQTHAVYPGYLRTWVGGRRGIDGVIVEPDAYGPYRLVTVTWPDGRAVTVQSTNADAPTLERIARSIQLRSRAQADALVNDLNARLAALPTLHAVSLPTTRVELHTDGAHTAICLRVVDSAPFCRANVTLIASANYIAGSALLADQWLILTAAPTGRPTVTPSTNTLSNTSSLPAQTATLGEWHLALVPVPPSVGQVQVNVPTQPNQFANATFTRPSPPA